MSCSKNDATCSRITWPVPPLLLLLRSFIPKKPLQSTEKRRSRVLYWCSFHVCLNFWSCLFVMEWGVRGATDTAWRCGHRSIRHLFSVPSQKVGTDGQCCLSHTLPILTWLQGSPVTCVPGQHIDLLLSLPFWAVCFLLVPRGSPKGVFRVSLQGGEAQRVFLTLQRREVKSVKKKKKRKSHTQTHTNLL